MSSSSESFHQGQDEEQPAEMSQTPTLDTLVQHLLSAKRSLSAIESVWRADEIRALAQHAVEESVITQARSGFVREGIEEQMHVLQKVKTGVEGIATKGQEEFVMVLKDLDAAEARLTKTMNALRNTPVEPSFRRSNEEQKHLIDFVDEKSVEELTSAIKHSIDVTNDASSAFASSNATFFNDLAAIKAELLSKAMTSSAAEVFHSPLPSLLASLEFHAQEAASLLESLVKHYDLCVTALKHTEGGPGIATAESIIDGLPSGVAVNTTCASPELITAAEHQEMLAVLEKDALEVDEVVAEIHDRVGEMETKFELVLQHKYQIDAIYASSKEAFNLLSQVGSRVPAYIAASRAFTTTWNEQKTEIATLMSDLDALRNFFQDFSFAYDELIIEVARRKQVQARMEKILQDALNKVDKLYEDDLAARESFKQDRGDFLPIDIWPGLVLGPRRYEIKAVSQEGDGGGVQNGDKVEGGGQVEELPNLEGRVIEGAFRRLQRKGKM